MKCNYNLCQRCYMGSAVGQMVEIETADSLERAVRILGPARSGEAEEMRVRFLDGVVDDWKCSEFAPPQWQTGTLVDIDTAYGMELGVKVLGHPMSGNVAELRVKFADGTVDDWEVSDFIPVHLRSERKGGGATAPAVPSDPVADWLASLDVGSKVQAKNPSYDGHHYRGWFRAEIAAVSKDGSRIVVHYVDYGDRYNRVADRGLGLIGWVRPDALSAPAALCREVALAAQAQARARARARDRDRDRAQASQAQARSPDRGHVSGGSGGSDGGWSAGSAGSGGSGGSGGS